MNLLVRKWGERIIRSRQYAAGVALMASFFSFFDMPIGWLSTVIIALVTLQNGPRQGLIIMAWAILPAVAMLYLGQYAVFLNIVFLHYVVALAFAVVLRKWGSWINVFQLSALMGMVAVTLIYYFVPELQTWVMSQLPLLAKEYKPLSMFNFKPADIDLCIKYIGMFATGLLALAVLMTNLATLFLARWWQSKIVPTLNLWKECYGIRLHYSSAILLVILSLGLSVNSALFINLLLVAIVPFAFCGLSLLHVFAAARKNASIFIFVFYTLFFFFSPYVLMLLTLMGWLDSFFNFRRFLLNSAIEEVND